MSEKLSIQEAGKSRNFSGVGVIETETPEGDSCFWVPESERELETEYVIKNGTYRPKEYGFSDIHVNVFDLTTDLDGNDWKIDIGDIDMPDISLPDFDIDLSLDLNGMPNIEFGIHIITADNDEIKVELPGGEEIVIHGPSLTDPVVILDAIEISYDPSTGEWTVTALVECTVGEITYNPGDVIKTWPGAEKVDFYIHAGIALPDLSKMIDLDAGFDVSLDVGDMGIDISGIDLDGLDINISIDLDTLEVEEEYLPTSIKIITQPNKLEYKDGEPIDLTGMVVSAYYHDGTAVWANEKYPNGIIPLGELIVDPKYAKNSHFIHKDGHTATFASMPNIYYGWGYNNPPLRLAYHGHMDKAVSGKGGILGFGSIFFGENRDPRGEYALSRVQITEQPYLIHAEAVYQSTSAQGNDLEIARAYVENKLKNEQYNPYTNYKDIYTKNNKSVYLWDGVYGDGRCAPANKYEFVGTYSDWLAWLGPLAWEAIYGTSTSCEIKVSWPRPKDGKILSTTLFINVEKSDNTTDEAGHYGGTAISGDNGGSHYSGKF